MPSTRPTRASTQARQQLLDQLKDDHKKVRKAYRDFQKLDPHEDTEACEQIVRTVCMDLTVHATLEEELLYPAARGAVSDESLVEEAEVEHESMRSLIEQLNTLSTDDDKFAARFTVLCEYVLHHVKEEESEMFPQLERARLDWEALYAEFTERRAELMPAEAMENGADGEAEEEDDATETESAEPASGRRVAAKSGSGRGASRR
jgi:hemerythrin superfamily protein